MKFLYLDCFAGISGDMFLGALIDLGISLQELSNRLAGLRLEGYRLAAEKTFKHGISGTKFSVLILQKQPHHRHLPDILHIINESILPGPIKEKSSEVFISLAAAEAKIHNIPADQVLFHEAGAIDSIIDIVGTVTALEILEVEQVLCSPLPLGSGFIECAHGTLPLPAPAALELLRGMPTTTCDIHGETITPTGAALVKTLAAGFGPLPSMQILSIGYGAGEADRNIPNLCRAILGESLNIESEPVWGDELTEDFLNLVEANIDDMNPEFYDYIIPLLFSAGAVDVYLTPVIMKKGRPAHVITCLVPDRQMSSVITSLLAETTTLGVRTSSCRRYKLTREITTVQTTYGPIRVKLGRHPATGSVLNIAPEWEDCKTAAQENGIPVKIVYDSAKTEAYKKGLFQK